MPKMLRRVESSKPWAADLNRLLDVVLGNTQGQLRLYDDDGDRLDLISGDVESSNNYPLDIRSGAGFHQRIRKSDDSADVLTVKDSGVAFRGTLTGTGNTSLTGTLSVSGLLAAAGAATVGTTLTVGGKLTAGSAEVTGLFAAVGAATVGTTLTVGGLLTAGGGIHLPNNVALRSDYSISNINLVRLDSSGIFRLGTPAVARTFLHGDTIELLNSTGTVFMVDGDEAGFFGEHAPQASIGSAATDLASAISRVNQIRNILIDFGIAA